MPWYDATVSVTHTYTITTTHDVTIEAPDFRAAQKKAAAQALENAGPDSETYLSDCDHVESSLDDVVSMAEVNFQESPPEARFFEDQWRVYLLEPQGISDGSIVLWSEEARRIREARRTNMTNRRSTRRQTTYWHSWKLTKTGASCRGTLARSLASTWMSCVRWSVSFSARTPKRPDSLFARNAGPAWVRSFR